MILIYRASMPIETKWSVSQMYVCNDPVCDACCDFCWFCVHDNDGVPINCAKDNVDSFFDGIGYCDEFKCALHEERP